MPITGDVAFRGHDIYGYAHVPPTPFMHKDSERYDVSRYTPPGCVSPEDGYWAIPRPANEIRYATIMKDLDSLAGERSLEQAIFLFTARLMIPALTVSRMMER